MAKFCRNCGSKRDKKTGLCPKCDAEKMRKIKKRRKSRRICIGILCGILLGISTCCILQYMGVFELPFLKNNDNEDENLLGSLNEENIIVEKKDVVMKNEKEGTATIVIKIPDYELLFEKACKSDNPEKFVIDALRTRDYDIQEYEETVDVTVENGVEIVHSEEIIQKRLEEILIKAVQIGTGKNQD